MAMRAETKAYKISAKGKGKSVVNMLCIMISSLIQSATS